MLAGLLLATPGFEHHRQLPQPVQFIAERKVGQAGFEGTFIEQRFDVVVAQVRHHRNALDAALAATDDQIRRHIEVEGNGRHTAARSERAALDYGVRQHGDLAPRHVNGGQSLAGDGAEFRVGNDTKAWGGDMDADAHRTVGIDRDGKGVVDFGGLGVVDGKRGHVGQRQLADFGRRRTGGEVRAARKVFEEETAEVILVAVGNGTAGAQQFDG